MEPQSPKTSGEIDGSAAPHGSAVPHQPALASPNPLDNLPFDIWTLAKGVWSWKWILVVGTVLSVFVAAGISYLFAPQFWVSEAVLIYHAPSDESLEGVYEDPGIGTHIKMVLVDSVLQEVRRRVRIEASIGQIASACTVDNPKGTEMVHIRFKWTKQDIVEPMASAIAEVFLAEHRDVRSTEYHKIIRKLEQREILLHQKIAGYEKANKDVRALAQWKQEMDSLQTRASRADLQLEDATQRVTSLTAEIRLLEEELEATIEQVQQSAEARARSESLSNLNMRSGRIREKIMSLKEEKVNAIEFDQWEEQLDHLAKGLARGFISQAEYKARQASFQKFQAQITDTEEEAKLKEELEAIYEKMLATGSQDPSSNESVRRIEDRLSARRLELESLQATITGIEQRRAAFRTQLAAHRENEPLPPLNSARLLGEWQTELDQVQDRKHGIETLMDGDLGDFQYLTTPSTPSAPSSSLRKLFFVALSGLGPMVLLVVAVGVQLLDTRVKSAAEVSVKLKQELLGSLPDVGSSSQVSAEGWESQLFEPIRSMARRIRAELPLESSKVMIVSVGKNEGSTTLAVHLARCFGQQGESVVLVDGAIREGAVENDLRQLVLADGEEPDGLGDFLAGNVDDVEQIVWPTTLYGVSCIPSAQFGIVPELLGSRRMRDLVDDVVQDHNLLIIDGPPISTSSDAEILCSLVDAVIVVVEACRFRSQSIKRSLQRISDTGVPVMGVVLNKVPSLYVESQWK